MRLIYTPEVIAILKAILTAVLISGALFVCAYYRKRVTKFFTSLHEVMSIIPEIQTTLMDMDVRGNKRACEMRMVFKTLRALIHAIKSGDTNGNLTVAQQELDDYLAENLS
jgi:phosphosulfolactate synthase (CoM biosynthesis protein A)